MINIVLADDHKMIIDGLQALLAEETNIRILGQAINGTEVIEILRNETQPVDLVILDINMPGMDGIETTKYIRKNFPTIKILILSMYNKPVFIKHLVEEGVSGYIMKNTGKKELLNAICRIMDGEEYYAPDVTKAIMSSLKTPGLESTAQLTKRELEILRLLTKALTTAEIADRLFLSPFTVDTHRKNLLSKLNQKNTPGLVKYAIENGLATDTY